MKTMERTMGMEVNRRGRWIALALLAAIALAWAGCVRGDGRVSVDFGSSSLYSRAEMEEAVAVVVEDFAGLAGCRLISLSFAGDERCRAELEYANRDRAPGELYTACIVFDSVFRSPVAGGGAWEANELYRWSWILARTGDGAWTVINRGYA